MKFLLSGLFLINILISCSQTGYDDQERDRSVFKETITRGDVTLVYSYTKGEIPYGEETALTLNITYPSTFTPWIDREAMDSADFIENGLLLNVEESDPLLIDSSFFNKEINITFEAFLPGEVTIHPVILELRSGKEGTLQNSIFKTEQLTFLFRGDPSLLSRGTEQAEPAGLIEPRTDQRNLNLLISILIILLISTLIIVLLFLKKRRAGRVNDLSDQKDFSVLIRQFKKSYLNGTDPGDLRPAFRELKQIIRLSPYSFSEPETREEYLNRCNSICFQGRRITDKNALEELRDMFLKIQGETEDDI